MIHHDQKNKSLEIISKTPQRRQKQITVKFDTELANQVNFLAQHLEIKQLEVLRQLVKKKLNSLGLWNTYLQSPKRYTETELILKK